MREWIDANTGRTVRQLTDHPAGAGVGYFRWPRRLPADKFLAMVFDEQRTPLTIDIATGQASPLELPPCHLIKLEEKTGTLWYRTRGDLALWKVTLPDGAPQYVTDIPAGWEGRDLFITCDGKTGVGYFPEVDPDNVVPPPATPDLDLLLAFFNRPRWGSLKAFDLQSGEEKILVETQGVTPIHGDVSPTDPTLLKFAHDNYDAICQRIWTVRTDGSELRKIRPQEYGELVTHEFWWPDGQLIAYKYQDRRKDETLMTLPWAEYSPIPTQFGLSNLQGEEIYLSDPINHYHTHINVSPDASRLSGEGTENNCFVYAANFSQQSTKIDFIRQATINTPYAPFRGQFVDASYSADGEWIVYNDTVGDKMQVCAVKVEL